MNRAAMSLACAGLVLAVASCASNRVASQDAPSTVYRLSISTVGRTPSVTPSQAAPGRRTTAAVPPRTPPVPPAAAAFAWADGDSVPDAFSLTVVRGLTPRQALHAVAPDATTGVHGVGRTQRLIDRHDERLDPDDPYAYAKGLQLVAATSREGWTIVYEDNGFQASLAETAGALSRRGSANVLYCSINADYTYSYARAGRVVREFDPFLGDPRIGPPLAAERGLPFARGDNFFWTNAMSFELTRRLTGFTVRPSDLNVFSYAIAVGRPI